MEYVKDKRQLKANPNFEGRFNLTPVRVKRFIDLLKIEKLKKDNPEMTYKEMAEALGFSKTKISGAFDYGVMDEIPKEIRQEMEGKL